MKAEIKTKEKGFEPIELNITIESFEELVELKSLFYQHGNKYTNSVYYTLLKELIRLNK
jgi:hypothetical protein